MSSQGPSQGPAESRLPSQGGLDVKLNEVNEIKTECYNMSGIVFDVAIGLFVIIVGGALINGMFKGGDQNAFSGVAVGAGTRRMKRSRRKKIIT